MLMDEHIARVLSESTGLLYALSTLKAHGLQQTALQEVFRAKILSKIMYSSPAWWGFSSAENIRRINAFLKKSMKLQFYPENAHLFETVWLCR